MATCYVEVHHRIPQCLLASHERYVAGDLGGEGLQAWFDWEEEAFRYGVDPDVSRVDLAGLIEASAAPIPISEHRRRHSDAGDFSRWGRRGGLATLALYGRPWFSLLGRRRWGRAKADELDDYRAKRLSRTRRGRFDGQHSVLEDGSDAKDLDCPVNLDPFAAPSPPRTWEPRVG